MRLTKLQTFLLYIVMALIAGASWTAYTYPQLSFIKLSIDRNAALDVAGGFLKARGFDPSAYTQTAVYRQDNSSILFLQRTIGIDNIREYAERNDIDLFYWSVRYFRPKEKEELRVLIDSSEGKVIGFAHEIETGTEKKKTDKSTALNIAIEFLRKQTGFDPSRFQLKNDEMRKFDRREEYSFMWELNGSRLVWDTDKESAKVIVKATVTGEEILSFQKNALAVPNEFFRGIEAMKNLGNNLSAVVMPFKLLLLVAAIYFVLRSSNHLIIFVTRNFYLSIAAISFGLSMLGIFNFYPELLNGYNTTVDVLSFHWQTIVQLFISAFFVALITVLPGLAGEALGFENSPDGKSRGFIGYLRTTFMQRKFSEEVFIGYLAGIILLGFQAFLFAIGRRWFGLWLEYNWLTQLTSAFIPFLAVFSAALKASISEEFAYRLFGVNWGKKLFGNFLVSCLVFSLLWGLGHSTYAVYPMWFRSLEVTLLGLFICHIFLRFGIVAALVAHYFFDVFWMSAAYLFGQSNVYYLSTTLLVISLPGIIALAAFIMNRVVAFRPMRFLLNEHQKFNANVLREFLGSHPEICKYKEKGLLKKEIMSHGWDAAVVETVLDDINHEGTEKINQKDRQ
jgi:predicted RNA-binding protein with PUA domain